MRTIDWLRKPRTYGLVRKECMALMVIGLAFFYGAAIIAPALSWSSPELIWKTGLIMTAVGALGIVGLVAWIYPKGQKLTGETVFGFLALLTGFISLLVTFGDEKSGLQIFWLVMTVFILPSGWAIVVLGAVKNRKPRPAKKTEKSYKRLY